MSHFPKIVVVNTQNEHNKKRVSTLKTNIDSLKSKQIQMTETIERVLNFNNEVSAMIKVLYMNYGERLPSKVPIRELPKFDFEKIQEVASKAFAERFTGKIELASLRAEVKEPKKSNTQLAKSAKQFNDNFQSTSNMLAKTMLDLQAKLSKLVGEEPSTNKPEGKKKTFKGAETKKI